MNLQNLKREDDPFTGKIFMRLWRPALISSAGLAFSDMADAFFVGRTTGEVGLAAIAICLPLYMIINIFMYGLGVGGANRFSTLMSEGKLDDGRRCYNHVIQGSVMIGLLIALIGNLGMEGLISLLGATAANPEVHSAAVTYGRLILGAGPFFMLSHVIYYLLASDNREKEANICFATACVVDIFLNMFYVSVLHLGTFGAGLSTLTGQVFACVLYMIIVIKNQTSVPFKPLITPDIKEVINCFVNGFSTSIGYLWQIFYFSIVNHVLLKRMGADGVAAFDVLQNISYLFMYIYESVVKAMEPMVSTYSGERNTKGQKNALFMGVKCGSMLCLVFIILVCIFPKGIAEAFGINSANGVEFTKAALRCYCVGALFMGLSTILEGYDQARGNERDSYILTTLRGAVVLFPGILLFSLVKTDSLFWWAFPAVEITSLLIYLIFLKTSKEREISKAGENEGCTKITENVVEGKEKIPSETDKSPDLNDDEVYCRTIRSSSDDFAGMLSEIEEYLDAHEASVKQSMLVNMAVEETVSAIMNYAFKDDEEGYIAVTLFRNDDFFELHVRDSAVKFDLFSIKTGAITSETESDDDIIEALGIFMVKKKARTFSYRHHQGFNTLVVTV